MLGPDAVPARGQYAVGIHGILQSFVEAQERVIIEGVGVHHRCLMRRSGAIFAPAMLGGDLNQLLEGRAILLVRLDVVGDRKTEKENECSLPVARRQAERRDGQVEILRRLSKYSIGLKDRFARPGNYWREPDVPISRRRIRLRSRANRKHLQARDAELREI